MNTMNFYKNILKVGALLLFSTLYAQQEPTYALYRYSMNAVNPAYAAVNGESMLTTNLRSQWIDVDGAPETQTVFFSTPLTEKLGIGLTIINDAVFVENRTSFNVDLSYKLKLNETSDIYLGIKAGARTYDIDRGRFGTFNFNNGQIDPSISNIDTGFRPTIGAGALLQNDKYFVSLSVPILLLSERVDINNGRVSAAGERAHIYLAGGYNFDLSDKFEFRPSTMVRAVGGLPLSADITAAFRYLEKFEVAGMYSTDDNWAASIMFNLADWMDFGYAYGGATRNQLNSINDGTHEVLVRFKFNGSNNDDE